MWRCTSERDDRDDASRQDERRGGQGAPAQGGMAQRHDHARFDQRVAQRGDNDRPHRCRRRAALLCVTDMTEARCGGDKVRPRPLA